MENKKTHAGKTLLSAFLAFVLAVSMTPMPAYADEAAGESGTTTNGTIGVEGATLEATTPQETVVPLPVGKTLTYNGEWQLGIDPAEGWTFECADGIEGHFDPETGCYKTDAGEYECTLRLEEGYVWENGSHDDATVAWSIKPKAIAAPAGSELTANGKTQQGVSAGEGYNLSGDTEATDTGDYTATATLQPNYIWDDSTTEPKQIAWTIVADGQVADGDAIEGEDVKAQAEEDPEVSAQALISVSIPKGGTFENESVALGTWINQYYSYEFDGYYMYRSDGDGLVGPVAIAYSSTLKADGWTNKCTTGRHVITYTLLDGYCWADGSTNDKQAVLQVDKKDSIHEISDCSIELSYTSCTYNGKKRKPTVAIYGETYDGETWNHFGTLSEGRDYTAQYSNNINAGTATITIEGINGYCGTIVKTFIINKKSLSNATIELSRDAYTANGTFRKPLVDVALNDQYLIKDKDFTVSYSNNKNVGEATVTVSGKGNYKGTITANFLILPSKTGWFKAGSSWYYKTQLDVARGWKTIGNVKYYFNPKNGKMATGLWSISGKKYYFSSDGAMQKNSWKSYNGSWYYFSSTGAAKSGWLSQGDTWYYLNPSNNKMATGLWNIDGKKYYFNNDGSMASSCWKSYGGDWYYLASSGIAKSGWLSQGGTWYYLDSETKAMVTGLKKIDGKRYYFNKSGVMASNRWERINYSWYYFTSSGAAKSGWLQWGGDWYWFDSTGRGASDEGVHINGSYYFFNYDGVWIKSASKGARGWVRATDRVYYSDGDYCDCNSYLYYINSYGELLGADTGSGYYTIGNYEYYFSSSGQALWRDNYYTGETEYWTTSSCYRYYGCDGCYWSEW